MRDATYFGFGLIKFCPVVLQRRPVGSETLVRLASEEHRARVTKLVFACTIVLVTPEAETGPLATRAAA